MTSERMSSDHEIVIARNAVRAIPGLVPFLKRELEAEIIDKKTSQLIETKVIAIDISGAFRDCEAITTNLGPRTIVRASLETKPVPGGIMTTYYKVWVK